MICLVTSQVISHIKARAEANGLRGDGGLIERPERLILVLAGAGFSDLLHFPLPWLLPVAMWVLAALSRSPSRSDCTRCGPPRRDRSASAGRKPRGVDARRTSQPDGVGGLRVPLTGRISDLVTRPAGGWCGPCRSSRPQRFDAGAWYASRGGGPTSCAAIWRGWSGGADEVPAELIRRRWSPTRGTGGRRSGCRRWI